MSFAQAFIASSEARRDPTPAEHIAHLLAQYEIKRRPWTGQPRFWAHADGTFSVELPPLRGDKAYLIALHEIGHVATYPGSAEFRADILRMEALAWEWALDSSVIPITEELLDFAWHSEAVGPKASLYLWGFGLGSYVFSKRHPKRHPDTWRVADRLGAAWALTL